MIDALEVYGVPGMKRTKSAPSSNRAELSLTVPTLNQFVPSVEYCQVPVEPALFAEVMAIPSLPVSVVAVTSDDTLLPVLLALETPWRTGVRLAPGAVITGATLNVKPLSTRRSSSRLNSSGMSNSSRRRRSADEIFRCRFRGLARVQPGNCMTSYSKRRCGDDRSSAKGC